MKVPLPFLSPELSQAPAFPSAALKGTSRSPSLGSRKVVGGKTVVKRLSIPLHRKRFKAWLGLPWQHICLIINPKKPCSSRLQSFVSREEPGRNYGGPKIQTPMESCFPIRLIVNCVPSLCWCWVIVTAIRWHHTGWRNVFPLNRIKETKVLIFEHLFQYVMHSMFPGSTLVPRGL